MNQPGKRYKKGDLFDDYDPDLVPERGEEIPAGHAQVRENLPPMRPGALIDFDRIEDLFDL